MKARALTSFVAPGLPPVTEGDEIEVPDGADWIKAGLCEKIASPKKAPAKKSTTSKKSDA